MFENLYRISVISAKLGSIARCGLAARRSHSAILQWETMVPRGPTFGVLAGSVLATFVDYLPIDLSLLHRGKKRNRKNKTQHFFFPFFFLRLHALWYDRDRPWPLRKRVVVKDRSIFFGRQIILLHSKFPLMIFLRELWRLFVTKFSRQFFYFYFFGFFFVIRVCATIEGRAKINLRAPPPYISLSVERRDFV